MTGGNLRGGKVKSCNLCSRIKDRSGRKLKDIPEHIVWRGMIRRCYNNRHEFFNYYGARGITVCERWRESYANFIADMGHRPSDSHSIDRINNDGNYEPTNCRWATTAQQQRNRRCTVLLELDGETRTIREWAELRGWAYQTISARLRLGWSAERALTEEPEAKGKRSYALRHSISDSV